MADFLRASWARRNTVQEIRSLRGIFRRASAASPIASGGWFSGSLISVRRSMLLRLHHADMELAELLLRHFAGRVHHQVLRLLIHGEHGHFAQVLFARDQHDDSVDSRRRAAMGRR